MFSNTEIKEAILMKFYTLKDCAEAMGVSNSTLSRLMKKPSLKFIDRLKNIGVEFSNNNLTNHSILKGHDMMNINLNNSKFNILRENKGQYINEYVDLLRDRLNKCEEENMLLRAEIIKLKKK